jgi:hypothetical protein
MLVLDGSIPFSANVLRLEIGTSSDHLEEEELLYDEG